MEKQKIIIAYDDEGNQIMIEPVEGAPIEIYYDGKPVTLETAPQEIAGKIANAIAEFAKGGNGYQSGYEWYMSDGDYRLEIVHKAVYLGRVTVVDPDVTHYSEVVGDRHRKEIERRKDEQTD